MTPPSIERRWSGRDCAFTWWIPDATMESERRNKKISPPDAERFNRQLNIVRGFDQLICNVDRNLQNLLITPDWNLWMIVLAASECAGILPNRDTWSHANAGSLRNLTRQDLAGAIGRYCKAMELDGLLARRDRIVARFETLIAERGESKVVYDLPRRQPVFEVPEPGDQSKHPIS
jgi:hypothetical protein